MIKILFLEDDKRLSSSIIKLFKMDGILVTHLETIEDLHIQLQLNDTFDVVILDRLIHGEDSKSSISKIKQKLPRTSLLILSAINTPDERAELINLGADDYVGKPFSSNELLARIKSLSRKYSNIENNYTVIGNTTVDIIKRLLITQKFIEPLPAKEFLVLKALTMILGKVCNRAELLESIWGANFETETNVVESTIANLRKKLTGIHSDIKIKNSRNSGYWIEI